MSYKKIKYLVVIILFFAAPESYSEVSKKRKPDPMAFIEDIVSRICKDDCSLFKKKCIEHENKNDMDICIFSESYSRTVKKRRLCKKTQHKECQNILNEDAQYKQKIILINQMAEKKGPMMKARAMILTDQCKTVNMLPPNDKTSELFDFVLREAGAPKRVYNYKGAFECIKNFAKS